MISQRQYPDLIEAYMRFTSGHESTDRIRKWSFISVLAAALERRTWMDRGYYTLFPNLYVFIIGRSGLIKKSTSTAIAVNLLRELPKIKLMSERLTAASLIDQLANSGKQFEYNGRNMKQSALFAYASELAVFLQEVFGSITELLTTFYDCQPNDSTKPWTHNTKGSGNTEIYGPCLNVLGASTKSWLTKCIPKTEMEGGFTSRIIFVVENKLPVNLVAWPEIGDSMHSMRTRLIEDLNEIYSLRGPFHVEADAKDYFGKWYEFHMRNVMPLNMDPRMIGYMSRKGDTILKLAMIRSVSLSNKLVITKDHIMWGQEELDALESDWRGAFDGLGVKDGLGWDLRNFIRSRRTINKKELFDTFASQYPIAEVARELNELIAMHEVTEVPPLEPGAEGFYSFSGEG